MKVNVKRLAVTALAPFARLARAFQPLGRAWAHARLAASIDGPLDASVVVLGVPEVHGTRRVRLGRNLFLFRDVYLETQGTGSIDVGDDVVMSRGVHLVSYARIEIGAGSMIGEYTSIRDANHGVGSGEAIRYADHDAAPIHIGAGAWIGRGVTVLRGVTIGTGAVVGANAVVTHDVPPGAIVAGTPARPLRQGTASAPSRGVARS